MLTNPVTDQLVRDYAAENVGCRVIETELGVVLIADDTAHFRRLAFRLQDHIRRVATLERALKKEEAS